MLLKRTDGDYFEKYSHIIQESSSVGISSISGFCVLIEYLKWDYSWNSTLRTQMLLKRTDEEYFVFVTLWQTFPFNPILRTTYS